jgi:ribosomal-protein-alanine N-acetyltransferase
VAGRGAATAAVRDLCRRAVTTYDLRMLRAAASDVASQRVLVKAGFRRVGPADIHGRPATRFRRDLPPRSAPAEPR